MSLAQAIRTRFRLDAPVESHTTTDWIGRQIRLETDADAASTEQAYSLRVTPELIHVRAGSPAGLRYGVETLKQLLRCSTHSRIAACDIADAPQFGHRGILIDVSRGKVPRAETIIELMDWMLSVKLNVLMLYTEHVFQFRRHPELGKGASPMDAQTIRVLDREARRRHIDLIPTLQSLGHMHHLLKIKRYRHLAESEKRWSISPALDETYDLLADLYAEYLPNFSSRWFNANCDEPVDLGKGLSENWAKRAGVGGVYRKHLERVQKLAAAHGRRTMVWGDVVHEHQREIPKLDRRLMFLDWWYEEDHDFNRVRRFAHNGIDFMVCPGTSAWNSLFPRLHKAFANISGYARAGRRFGALGLINTDWGDGGHINLLGNSRMAFAWGAEESWSNRKSDALRFDRAFSIHTYDDNSGRSSRTIRRLGELHRVGFAHFNNSSVKTVFFDDLLEPTHLHQVKPGAVRRTLASLESIKTQLDSRPEIMAHIPDDRAELRWSVEASILAMHKAIAAENFFDWRQRPTSLSRAGRRRLEAKLVSCANDQGRLRRELRRLWLKRNERSNFEITSALFSRSIRSLRLAAKAMTR